MADETRMDRTRWDALYALLEGITDAAENEDSSCCGRLAHAGKMILSKMPIEDAPKKGSGK